MPFLLWLLSCILICSCITVVTHTNLFLNWRIQLKLHWHIRYVDACFFNRSALINSSVDFNFNCVYSWLLVSCTLLASQQSQLCCCTCRPVVPIWNLVVPCSFPRFVFFQCCFVLNWYDLNRVSILIWQDNVVTIGHRYMFVWCFYCVLVLGNRRLGSLILSTLLMNWFTEMSFIY